MVDLVLLTDNVSRIFYQIMLVIDGAVYWLMETAYQTFIVIANVRIFSSATFTEFADRIYALVGVIMLFVIAFQLLSNIVDPDKMNSGESSTGQIVKNIVTTLVIIILLPTVFKYMYKIQDVVLKENVVGNIILGPSGGNIDVNNGGKMVATYVFSAFINITGVEEPPDITCQAYGEKNNFCSAYNKFVDPSSEWYGKVSVFSHKESSEAESIFKKSTGNANYRKAIATEIDDGIVEYRFLISTAAGLICAYLFLSFSLDMGIRVAKLAYFQLVAPVPVAFRILPKQKSVFDNWVKSLTSTYLDVFIRLIIVFFCVFLLSKLNDVWNNIFNSSQFGEKSWMVSTLAKIIVIYGIFAFMKEAPKLIAKMFGLEAGDMGFGIKGKLKKAAVFGEGEPLSRENIARLNQNRILKKQSRADGGSAGGRFIDRFGQNLGFGTREDRAQVKDDAALAKIESASKAEQIEQRRKDASQIEGSRKSMRDRAEAIAKHRGYTSQSGQTYAALYSDVEKAATSADRAKAQIALEQFVDSERDYILDEVLKGNTITDGTTGKAFNVAQITSGHTTIDDIVTRGGAGNSRTRSTYTGPTNTNAGINAAFKASQDDLHDGSDGVEVRERHFASQTAATKAGRETPERKAMRADANTNKNLKPPSGGKGK